MKDEDKQDICKLTEYRNSGVKSLLEISEMFELIDHSNVLKIDQSACLPYSFPNNHCDEWRGSAGAWLNYYFDGEPKLVQFIKNNSTGEIIYHEFQGSSEIDLESNLNNAIEVYVDSINQGVGNPEKWFYENFEQSDNKIEFDLIREHREELEVYSVLAYDCQEGVESLLEMIKFNYPSEGIESIEKFIKLHFFDVCSLCKEEIHLEKPLSTLFKKMHDYFEKKMKSDENWKNCIECNQYKHLSAFPSQSENVCASCV